MKISNSNKGFTLIELLVVVAIIGVLSALLMENFVGIRQRARDGQRKSDTRQIQAALEFIRADTGSYPTDIVTNGILNCGANPNVSLTGGTSSIYMQTVPCDPLNSSPYVYQYTASSTSYCLRSCLENSNDSQKDFTANSVSSCLPFTASPAITCTTSYTLQNP